MARRLKAERVDVRRKVQVVVDRLRHVHHAQPAAALFFELHRGKRGVVAANRDEHRDVQPQEREDRVLEVNRVLGRVRPRNADVRPAKKVNAAHILDGEGLHVVDVAVHQPFEAVAHANDLHALEGGTDRRRADDAVDAWRRTAADEDGQFLGMVHVMSSAYRESPASIIAGAGPMCRRV